MAVGIEGLEAVEIDRSKAVDIEPSVVVVDIDRLEAAGIERSVVVVDIE